MHVYIVGVNHRIQWWPPSPGTEWTRTLREFEEYLDEACSCLQIDLLAEEFSEGALRSSNSTRSTGRNVANGRGISHRFCDPSKEERESGGVASHDHEQRMRIWLQRILTAHSERVLFLCGDDHVEDFARLLTDTGHQVETLSQGWGKNWPMID